MPKMIYGINPIMEALKSEVPPEKIFIAHGARGIGIREIMSLASKRKVLFEQVGRLRFTQLGGERTSQNVAALISEYEYREITDILEVAQNREEPAQIALLDNIEDPRNFGAIIRSAEAFGIHGVVIPKHRAVGITDTVASTSAGTMAHMAISRVTNLVTTMEELKEAGIWIAGAVQDTEKTIYEMDFTGPMAIVMGSEGKGIRRLVRDKCDYLFRIPMKGKVNSLNVSVAAGIIFHEVFRQREPVAIPEEVE